MALQLGLAQSLLAAPQAGVVGLGVVHPRQAKPGVEAAGFGLFGKNLRLLLQLVPLPGGGDRLHHRPHVGGGGGLGQEHPEVVAPLAAGIKQQRVVAPLRHQAPPLQGPRQVAAGPFGRPHRLQDVVMDVDRQQAAGALLALGVQADQLGPVLMAAGEVPHQFVEGHHVLAPHRGDGQRHGLVGAALLPGLVGGQQGVLTPNVLAVHQPGHGPFAQLAGASLPLLADDRFAGRHGVPLPPLAPS